MDRITTRPAGLAASRGLPLFGKAAFAFAALAMAFGLAAWIVDFDFGQWLQRPASADVAGANSFVAGANSFATRLSTFDDRFGSGSQRDAAVISYPSRPVARSLRSDFDAEFGRMANLLAGPSRDEQGIQSSTPSSSGSAAVPMPRSRPVEASLPVKNDAPRAQQADGRTMFQKLADLVPMRFTLASLTPGDGLFADKPDLAALGYDNVTAVYDISARAVYLPNGAKLEAHSGLGSRMDDPAHVDERMVGSTPPNVYDLKPRERLFHGVPALRMTAVGENDTLGRSGLLVHSYMLGPNGDSNGCVSIREYDRFLKAYRSGEVRRLVVVPSLSEGLSASRRSTSPSPS